MRFEITEEDRRLIAANRVMRWGWATLARYHGVSGTTLKRAYERATEAHVRDATRAAGTITTTYATQDAREHLARMGALDVDTLLTNAVQHGRHHDEASGITVVFVYGLMRYAFEVA